MYTQSKVKECFRYSQWKVQLFTGYICLTGLQQLEQNHSPFKLVLYSSLYIPNDTARRSHHIPSYPDMSLAFHSRSSLLVCTLDIRDYKLCHGFSQAVLELHLDRWSLISRPLIVFYFNVQLPLSTMYLEAFSRMFRFSLSDKPGRYLILAVTAQSLQMDDP